MCSMSVPSLEKRRNGNLNIRNERGVVAIMVALSMAVLIGFVGLALDLGKLYVAKTELQNSADACALAAARELTGANTSQLVLAEAAGMTTGERHNVLFQDEQIAISSVTFSTSLASEDLTPASPTSVPSAGRSQTPGLVSCPANSEAPPPGGE